MCMYTNAYTYVRRNVNSRESEQYYSMESPMDWASPMSKD